MMYNNRSLQDLAEEIAEKVKESDRLVNQADQLVIEAAKMVVEAKRLVDAGDAGDIKWHAWAIKHIGLKTTRLDELHQIGSADDPFAEVQRIRELGKERAKKHREKKKAETPRDDNGDEITPSTPTPQPTSDEPTPRSEPAPDTTSDDSQSPPKTDIVPTGPLPDDDPRRAAAIETLIAFAKTADIERVELVAEFAEWAAKISIEDVRRAVKESVSDPFAMSELNRRRSDSQNQEAA